MIDFKGSHFEREIVLWGVRWYVAYPISDRQLEEMMEERGVEVDHSTLNRWVLKYVPLLEQAFRVRKRRVGGSWRKDETYVRTKGQWKYLYRAVDKAVNAVDCEAGLQGRFALVIQGDRPTWHTGEDYHRPEWRQHRSDRELQRGARHRG